MSKDIRDILKQIREGKSSLSSEESRVIESQLSSIDEFLTKGSIEQEQLLALIETLQDTSRTLAESSVQQEGDDVSTRMSNVTGWELASLVGLISALHASITARAKQSPTEPCLNMYINAADFLLAHSEARSRARAATLVRVLAKALAVQLPSDGNDTAKTVYEQLYSIILRHVQKHLVSREAETRPVRLQGAGATHQEEIELDDLSGWHNLETSYAAYRALIEGYGGNFTHLIASSPHAYDTFIGAAGTHLNRYVRQAACEMIGVICQCLLTVPPPQNEFSATSCGLLAPMEGRVEGSDEEPTGALPLGLFTRILGGGMEDSWCQVRLASTQASGALLRLVKHLSSPSSLPVEQCTGLWSLLVPRLCLNRHYATDSVRTAAHHAWRNITLNCTMEAQGYRAGGAGVLALSPVTEAVVEYYTRMTKHKNHMVCEAACAAIAELGSRVDPAAVEPYLPLLSVNLRSSLADTSWPIRDTAATAVGRFLRYNGRKLAPTYFCRPGIVDGCTEGFQDVGQGEGGGNMQEVVGDMLGLLFTCLREDPFRPVRESAAVGLVDICLHEDVELGCDVWFNIEKYIDDNVLALSLPTDSETDDTAAAVTHNNPGISGTSAQVKKNVQFIPDKMMASLMKSSAKASKPAKSKDSKVDATAPHSFKDMKSSAKGRWIYSDWQEEPGDSVSSRRSQRKKRKEILAQRVSAGWGCCLDCGAGDNGVVSPSEVSWSTLLLLRELRETVLISEQQISVKNDIDFDLISLFRDPQPYSVSATRYELCRSKTGTVHCLLWLNFKRMWTLLALDDYKDCAKFHTFLYEQVTSILKDWFPAPTPIASLQPPMYSPHSPSGQLPSTPVPPFILNTAPLADNIMHSERPFHSQFPPPPPESCVPVVIEGEQRQALHHAVRGVLLDHRHLWRRDVACMGGAMAKQWQDLLPESVSTVNAAMSAKGASIIDLHSPQKDCALDACLCEVRDVYELDFVRDMLAT